MTTLDCTLEPTVEQLVEYLEQHGVEAKTRFGRIYAKDEFMFCGTAHERTVEISPNLASVQKYLGY